MQLPKPNYLLALRMYCRVPGSSSVRADFNLPEELVVGSPIRVEQNQTLLYWFVTVINPLLGAPRRERVNVDGEDYTRRL